MHKKTFLLLALAFVGATKTRADFTEYYAYPQNSGPNFYYAVNHSGSYTYPANNWSILSSESGWSPTGQPGSPQVTASASQLFLDSGAPIGTGFISSDLRASIIAPTSGFWSFDFNLTLSPANISASRGGYYFINETIFALPEGMGTIANVFLNAGDSFGLGVASARIQQGVFANASMTVSNFSAPVPEPSAVALLCVGAGICGLRFARRRSI